MRPVALWLTVAWALVSFVPPFFAREPTLQIGGASLAMWIAAQVGPLVYVLLAWLYERRASRIEAQQRAQRGG